MERYRFNKEEAEDFIRKYDHERESLIRSIFRSDPNEWSLYDIIINTAHYASGDAAEVIVNAIEKIQKSLDDEALKEKLKNMSIAKRIETNIRHKLSSSLA